MVTPIVLCTSKISSVKWDMGLCEVLMKLTTIAKVSKPTQNIQRSNEHVQVTRYVKLGMTYFWLFPSYMGTPQSLVIKWKLHTPILSQNQRP
jgi:hypothetical protein